MYIYVLANVINFIIMKWNWRHFLYKELLLSLVSSVNNNVCREINVSKDICMHIGDQNTQIFKARWQPEFVRQVQSQQL